MTERTGGQVLVDQLLIHGVDLAFCVPGESYLGVLDALHQVGNRLRLITNRNEIGSVNMAEAYGKATGRPGICLVTRGPGASHAMVGVHTAWQDSTPLILFVGLISRDTTEREAFQEIDLKAMFGHTAKWVAEITDPRRLPEMISHAFHTAVAGRPGPVVIGLPEDMCLELCETKDVAPYQVVRPAPTPSAISDLARRLATASRPLMIVGGGGWNDQAIAGLRAFAEDNHLPVVVSFRSKGLFDNRHPCYAGDLSLGTLPTIAQRVRDADLLLVVGARLGEATTGSYTLVVPPVPTQRLIHVHASAEELGRVYQGEQLICSGMAEFAEAVADIHLESPVWKAWTQAARADYLDTLRVDQSPGTLDLGAAMRWLSDTVPADTVYTSDAGNFATWFNRYIELSPPQSLIGPVNGAMGYGVPATIAVKLVHPDRLVVGFVGDGGFLMCGQELATAVHYGTPVVYLLFNNGIYGTIRMHQARTYPDRYPATELHNPDFVAYAHSFGAYGERVATLEDFKAAFARAVASGRPAVLELVVDPEAITTRTTLTKLATAAKGTV